MKDTEKTSERERDENDTKFVAGKSGLNEAKSQKHTVNPNFSLSLCVIST